jgi:ketosteroid isomerase-like protein
MRKTFLNGTIVTGLWIVCAVASGQAAPAPAPDTKAAREVRAVRDQLVEAAQKKDRAAYERLLADGFTFIHGTGGLESRKEYIDHSIAGGQLLQRAELQTLSEQIQVYDGHTAVWTSRTVARNKSDGTETNLESTNVFIKRDGRWLWAAGQSTRLPSRPKAAAVPPGLYDAYAGRYEIGPGRTLTVTKEDGTLRAVVTGYRPAELIPRSETEFVWFNPEMNVYSQVIFVKGEDGKVTAAAFRREGEEVWRAKRVQ